MSERFERYEDYHEFTWNIFGERGIGKVIPLYESLLRQGVKPDENGYYIFNIGKEKGIEVFCE